jgi:hypothetical protein
MGANHQHQHHHHDYGPSGEGTVVLDIGGDTGAVVVHTSSALAGSEIELARRGEDGPFVHTAVRERHLPGSTMLAAVFAEVLAGEYTLIGFGAHPSVPVTVTGGCVTEFSWSEREGVSHAR